MNELKIARKMRNMTQEQLSALTGIPARTIQNWENGVRKCPDYVFKMLLDKLNDKLPELKKVLNEDIKKEKSPEVIKYIDKLLNLLSN